MFFLINARASSGAEGVGKQLYCVQCSDSGTTNSPTRQGSAQNDKIVHKMSEKSTYIRELHSRGKFFHKKHSNRMTRIIFNSDIEYCIVMKQQ